MSETSTAVEYIDHIAVVKSIDPKRGEVTLELSATPECQGCAAARVCNPSGETLRTLTLHADNAYDLHPGDRVTLRGTERLHHKAILIATVIPSIALIAVMIIIYYLTASEAAAALAGIGSRLLFVLLLYLSRNRLGHEFNFDIIPLKTT
ncbi:MAG: SoxR reducing system RseC family protein [Muribaculaceae bacterium]|nr:SoxR reducing system RseC family protein [Muribaculaceae bacterium]